MLSYQHALHIGNHADVHKHLILCALIGRYSRKSKGFFALDSHAGAGMYSVDNLPAHADSLAYKALLAPYSKGQHKSKTQQKDARSPCAINAIEQYIGFAQALDKHALHAGSSYLLAHLSREQDSVHLNELSASVFAALKASIFKDYRSAASQANTRMHLRERVHLHQRDAFEAIKGLVPPQPPQPKRGFVLIDPPYEQASEYEQVFSQCVDIINKWPQACVMIWYPLLSPNRIDRKTKAIAPNPKSGLSEHLVQRLKLHFSGAGADTSAGIDTSDALKAGMLSAQLCVSADSHEQGMYGSGVCVINPPFELDEDIRLIQSFICEGLNLASTFTSDNGDSIPSSALHWHIASQ